MKLAGKSREEIEKAVRNKTRSELIDLLYNLATLEPHFSPGTVAARRGMSKDTIIALCKNGTIPRVHKPLQNSWRIPLSSIREWDEATAISFSRAA
jgi:hypothetical protein